MYVQYPTAARAETSLRMLPLPGARLRLARAHAHTHSRLFAL